MGLPKFERFDHFFFFYVTSRVELRFYLEGVVNPFFKLRKCMNVSICSGGRGNKV